MLHLTEAARRAQTRSSTDAVAQPYRPLSDVDIDRIDAATMEVLGDVGIEVHEPEAFELFAGVAREVDRERRLVKLDERTVRELVAAAPTDVTLCGRAEEHDVPLGRGGAYFSTGGTALHVLDYGSGERRRATLADLVDIVRLTDRLPNVHLMLLPTYPNDLEVDAIDVNRFFAGLCYTQKHVMGGVYTAEGIRDVIAMAERVAGSPEALRRRPLISLITCTISPLRIDARYGGFLMQAARAGVPVAVPAEPLCGATSPVTLAGSLVIQNCDALANVILAQLVREGAPVIYGCVASSTDLHDMKYLGAPVESGLLNAGAAQLALRYGLPCYTTAGISDAKTLDAQCGYETAINNLLVALAGGQLIHDAAGLMEFALTVSKEKLVIDNDILGMALRACRGIRVDDKTLAVDVIRAVGPGGNFISQRHTRRHMQREHYLTRFADREHRDVWEQGGAKTAPERAHEVVEALLAEPVRTYVEDDVAAELRRAFPALALPPEAGEQP